MWPWGTSLASIGVYFLVSARFSSQGAGRCDLELASILRGFWILRARSTGTLYCVRARRCGFCLSAGFLPPWRLLAFGVFYMSLTPPDFPPARQSARPRPAGWASGSLCTTAVAAMRDWRRSWWHPCVLSLSSMLSGLRVVLHRALWAHAAGVGPDHRRFPAALGFIITRWGSEAILAVPGMRRPVTAGTGMP